jgi:hypothetical protein
MQTMDMIVVKKKRIALMERDSRSQKNRNSKETSTLGVWSMLKSVASVRVNSSESKKIFHEKENYSNKSKIFRNRFINLEIRSFSS